MGYCFFCHNARELLVLRFPIRFPLSWQTPKTRSGMGDSIRILVVDDSEPLRAGAARLLRHAGYLVEEAATGGECLEKISSFLPDLLLLDVNLPDANGFEICRTLKSDPHSRRIYVMMLSASRTTPDDRSEGLELGADGYMARPVSNRELLAGVRAMERIIRAERERDRLIAELQQALASIKVLKGLLPICSHCKKIRDDKGYWQQVEVYIRQHAEVEFSHGLCPECVRKLYPEYADLVLGPQEPAPAS